MMGTTLQTDIPKYYTEGIKALTSIIHDPSIKSKLLKPIFDQKYIKGCYCFNRLDKKFYHLKDPSHLQFFQPPSESPSTLTFQTQNIWFEHHNQQERYETIIQMMKQGKADFICLQEVIQPFINILQKHAYFLHNYYWSDISMSGYGTMILSRWPGIFYHFGFPTKMNRKLAAVQCDIGGRQFLVSTVHLQSLSNAELRRQQMEIAFKVLSNSQNSVLMGDFNFDSSWKKEEDCLPKEYIDLYLLGGEGRSSKAGYTMPSNGHYCQWRPDRLIAKLDKERSQPMICDIVGRFPTKSYKGDDILQIVKDKVVRTPSDHYGLIGTILLK